ncbi:MAG TPA: NAD(P)/FAD-dependent oxidoreductase [Candidatus Limnocylindria bacterium]|nr:NAD(P)/FAD-dependent oxidoreductase [Candidatus Limnocylindria bacterium]
MLDAAVIGAGHAGLSASHRLREAGLDHVVLERGEVGESWRSQRWDSFTLNTPNRMNRLPGAAPDRSDPDAFEHRDAWVARLERYAREQRLPVRTRTAVTAVERDDRGFVISVAGGAPLRARSVIVASGVVNAPKVPALAAAIDPRIARLTTGEYRNADQLAPGAVLVVGSAQSGCQIAEDLLDAGRTVYLATGTVGRVPRRVRGRDTLVWLAEAGWFDERPQDLPDRQVMRAAQPQISGVGPRGRTVSLQSLAARGVTLLGHLDGADGTKLRFAQDLAEHARSADAFSARIRAQVDEHIARQGIAAPPSEPDPADVACDPDAFGALSELDPADRGIGTSIFTTGFRADLSWLRVGGAVDGGAPVHDEGRARVEGLWFLGWTWMRRRKSGIIWGAVEDSAHVVDQVAERVARRRA